MKKNKMSGFTILEFLLVLIMFGLLMAVILPRAERASQETRFNLALQHGSEIAGYMVQWAQSKSQAQSESSSKTIHDFLMQGESPDASTPRPLVDRYTGNENFDEVEQLIISDHMPRNPFNNLSYFDPANDDGAVPADKPGLLYLASSLTIRKNQPYRYFYLIVTGMNNDWFGGMNHQDPEAMRRGIFVASMPEPKD